MFNFICGEVVEVEENKIVLKNNGIGYELTVSTKTAQKCNVGDNLQLWTYLQVKEDGISLFGFVDKDEKNMFLQLISVSGIGPKLACSVLSGATSDDLANAIVSGDTAGLCSIKGLGKKTAERIVLELREKVAALAKQVEDKTLSAEMKQAVAVLVSLGCSNAQALSKAQAAFDSGAKTVQQIVNSALLMG